MEKYYIEVISNKILCKLSHEGNEAVFTDFKVMLRTEGLVISFRGSWSLDEPKSISSHKGVLTWDTILNGQPRQELLWRNGTRTVICKVYDESFRRFNQALETRDLNQLAELFSESENDIFLDIAASLAYRQGCSNPEFRQILYDDILQNYEDGMKDNI